MRRKNGGNLNCQACGKTYYVEKSRLTISKYCSSYCQNKGQYPAIEKECPTCHTKFYVSNSRVKQKFCSVDCKDQNKKDIKETRKQQNLYRQMSRGKNSARTYRRIAFSFKEKKCQVCGYDEYDFCLDVHHIDGNPLNNHIDNLAVLCALCHRKLHKKIIDLWWAENSPQKPFD